MRGTPQGSELATRPFRPYTSGSRHRERIGLLARFAPAIAALGQCQWVWAYLKRDRRSAKSDGIASSGSGGTSGTFSMTRLRSSGVAVPARR